MSNVLTVTQLEETKGSTVWVMNTSKRLPGRKGDVLFNVPKMRGEGVDTIIVPLTFIPVELTTQCNKTQVLESAEFRRVVNVGLLEIVTPEHAEKQLDRNNQDIAEEIQRVSVLINSAGHLGALEGLGLAETGAEEQVALDDEQVSTEAANILLMLEDDDVQESNIVSMINNGDGNFTRRDYEAMGRAAKKANCPRVRKLCRERFENTPEAA